MGKRKFMTLLSISEYPPELLLRSIDCGNLKVIVLGRLITASKTYLAMSAECVLGFSTMTDTANKKRKPSIPFLDGAAVEQFDSKSFVLSWLKDGHRL